MREDGVYVRTTQTPGGKTTGRRSEVAGVDVGVVETPFWHPGHEGSDRAGRAIRGRLERTSTPAFVDPLGFDGTSHGA